MKVPERAGRRSRSGSSPGAGHALWVVVVHWLALRTAHLPADAGLYFKAWLSWGIEADTISLVLDARDTARSLKGDRAAHY